MISHEKRIHYVAPDGIRRRDITKTGDDGRIPGEGQIEERSKKVLKRLINKWAAFYQAHTTYRASARDPVDNPKQTTLFKQEPRSKLIFQTAPLICPNKPPDSAVMAAGPQWANLPADPGKMCSAPKKQYN